MFYFSLGSTKVQLICKSPCFLVLYSAMLSTQFAVIPNRLYFLILFCYSIVPPVFCCPVAYQSFHLCSIVLPVFRCSASVPLLPRCSFFRYPCFGVLVFIVYLDKRNRNMIYIFPTIEISLLLLKYCSNLLFKPAFSFLATI